MQSGDNKINIDKMEIIRLWDLVEITFSISESSMLRFQIARHCHANYHGATILRY